MNPIHAYAYMLTILLLMIFDFYKLTFNNDAMLFTISLSGHKR